MTARSIFILFSVFFFLELFWEQLLTVLNMRFVRSRAGSVPPEFADIVTMEQYEKSVRYTLSKNKFSLISSIVSSAVLYVMFAAGIFGMLDSWITVPGMHPYVKGIVYVAVILAVFGAVSLPFRIYLHFALEQRFGFNRLTPALFAADLVKQAVLTLLLLVPLLAGLFVFMDKAGSLWWLYAFLLLTAVQLSIGIIYPLVIAPLFNTFKPLEEGSLREKILDLAGKLKFPAAGIFVMDGSRRSGHSNAYFTGFGKIKRIVLYDTLVSRLSEDRIVAVLAHEIGHEKLRHILKHLAAGIMLTGLLFFGLGFLFNFVPVYRAFGFSGASYHAFVVILVFASSPFTFMFTPLFSMWSRKHEYEADRFAVQAVGSADPLAGALLKLGLDNLSNLTPHPLYSFYHYSHPTLHERIRVMRSYAQSSGRNNPNS